MEKQEVATSVKGGSGSPISSLTERKEFIDSIRAVLATAVSGYGAAVENLGHKRLRISLPDGGRRLVITINPSAPPTEEQQRAVREVLARIEQRRKNR